MEADYQAVLHKVALACQKVSRPIESVKLVAVSKQQPVSAIAKLVSLGQRDFAENYWQEACEKQAALSHLPIIWHFIGQLQSNKTRPIANAFDWVHSVSSVKVAKKLNEYRSKDKACLNLCLQVNVDQEATKQGFLMDQIPEVLCELQNLSRVSLRGLMCIPAPDHRQAFQQLQSLFFEMKPRLTNWKSQEREHWDTLSMGMSGDFEQAIAKGSTCIRVGTALFGKRG